MSESAYRFRYQNETNIQHIYVHNILKGLIHLTSGEGDADITDKLLSIWSISSGCPDLKWRASMQMDLTTLRDRV